MRSEKICGIFFAGNLSLYQLVEGKFYYGWEWIYLLKQILMTKPQNLFKMKIVEEHFKFSVLQSELSETSWDINKLHFYVLLLTTSSAFITWILLTFIHSPLKALSHILNPQHWKVTKCDSIPLCSIFLKKSHEDSAHGDF